jgi:hypothetical protein
MVNLDKLLIEMKHTKDPFVFAACGSCNWTGDPSECETYEDDDGWGTKTYTVAICPKCNEEEVIWLRKSEYEKYVLFTKKIS